jgi:hypothetical protein
MFEVKNIKNSYEDYLTKFAGSTKQNKNFPNMYVKYLKNAKELKIRVGTVRGNLPGGVKSNRTQSLKTLTRKKVLWT